MAEESKTVTVGSLAEAIKYVEEQKAQASVKIADFNAAYQEITGGFTPGKPVDAFDVVKIVDQILTKMSETPK